MADEVVSWVDADGGVTVLPVEWDVDGRFMPEVIHKADAVPGQPGERPRESRHGVREMLLPLWWTSSSDTALRIELRQLVDKMDPVNEDGTPRFGKVRVQSVLGDVRELTCLYSSGLKMAEKIDDASGPTWQKIPLTVLAHDPYWYDPSPTSQSFSLTQVPNFFPFGGKPMMRLAASQLAVDSTILNSGSVKAWPVWTITGPGTLVKLINLRTGLFLNLPTLTLGLGEVATIDTRPGAKTVTLQDGTDLYNKLDPASNMWPLIKGTNAIRLEMASITTASSLSVNYYQRYLSP